MKTKLVVTKCTQSDHTGSYTYTLKNTKITKTALGNRKESSTYYINGMVDPMEIDSEVEVDIEKEFDIDIREFAYVDEETGEERVADLKYLVMKGS